MFGPMLVTLTGASDDVDVKALVDLSAEFPFVEWGILYSHNQSGLGGKYPSRTWMDKFFDTVKATGYRTPMNTAIHLCGSSVSDYINDSLYTTQQSSKRIINIMEFLHPYFNMDNFRLQLNFTLPHIDFDLDELDSVIGGELFPVITQHKPKNSVIIEYEYPSNHQLLFDTSGGRGISPELWPTQIPEKMCGYAGGIGPANISQVLKQLSEIVVTPYWIDMENNLRTDDKFDLIKCRQVLEAVHSFGDCMGYLE